MTYTIISSCESRTGWQSKGYDDKAVRLARSIRQTGCVAPIVMWHGSDAKPSATNRTELERLGCVLQEGVCQMPGRPLWNKVEAITTCSAATDAILWIDSDVYVLDGLDHFDSITADLSAMHDLFSHHALTTPGDRAIWDKFYALCCIDKNKHKWMMLGDDRVNFHCNSGVFWMRNDAGALSDYRAMAEAICNSGIQYGAEYFDAVALVLLVYKRGLRWQALDEAYNYYYALHKDINGKFIHYQDNVLSAHHPVVWD
jgi:hypothetical protein